MDPINDFKMISSLEKAIKRRRESVPPVFLLDKIMTSIFSYQKKVARRWLIINSVLTAIVLGLFVYLSPQVYSQFMHSSLGTTVSLIWSDFGYVMANWVDFSWLLLESLPANAILIGLSGLLLLLFLVKSMVQNLDKAHYHFKIQKT